MRRTNTTRRRRAAFLPAVALLGACSGGGTDADSLDRYRLTTAFLGSERALSASRSADDDTAFGFDATVENARDQEWILTALDDGFYRITNRAFGSEESLDVINDGVFDRITLAPSEDVTGQSWQITPIENGYCRLTTEFLGAEIALDVAPETETPTLRAADNVTGQQWRLMQLGSVGLLDDLCPGDGPG